MKNHENPWKRSKKTSKMVGKNLGRSTLEARKLSAPSRALLARSLGLSQPVLRQRRLLNAGMDHRAEASHRPKMKKNDQKMTKKA